MSKQEKKDLYYEGEIIGYSIFDYEKNEIESFITAPISKIQEIIDNKREKTSIGFKEDVSEK